MSKISLKNKKICSEGHIYYRSSDCPVCPICEKKRYTVDSLFSTLSAPARRALENAGIKTIKQLSKKTEADILKLHGMGPGSLPNLREALKAKGMSFKN